MFRKLAVVLVAAVLVLGTLSGCGNSADNEPAASGAPAAAALRITGNVNTEIGWTEAELRALPTIEAQATNKDGQTLTYVGVPLNTLLEQAGVKAGATTVTFVADDGYTAETTLAELQGCADCIVAFRDGGGLSTVLPNFSNKLQVKGIVEIQVK